jgi:N-acetylmuramoyl-L-alanine amidase
MLFSKGVKANNFRTDEELWVPSVEFFINKQKSANTTTIDSDDGKLKTFNFELFGEKYKQVTEISHKLKGYVYYLAGGHGGPDPGAIGHREGNELHEDEYAYDIILRLARNLMMHGATVRLIVQDLKDGIRDGYYLNNSYDEVYYGNDEIPLNQLERLRKRVDIINNEYEKNKKFAKEQIVVPIHVDSRENKKRRVDIFFYYSKYSERGKYAANSLLNTFEQKYEEAQPGRGYTGSATSRGLYMLRHCKPVTVYMELGNIQNPKDQIRLIEKNNRQAIANWLTDGFLKLANQK